MTPRGHCFFCGDLTEYAVGKIPICEYCGDELFAYLNKAHKIIQQYEDDDKVD